MSNTINDRMFMEMFNTAPENITWDALEYLRLSKRQPMQIHLSLQRGRRFFGIADKPHWGRTKGLGLMHLYMSMRMKSFLHENNFILL